MTRANSLRVRRVYDPPEADDGARILVDRLWPRGLSKERAHLTLWLKDVAPSTALRKWFGHDPEKWDHFQTRYRAELTANQTSIAQIAALTKQGPVTLLYGARGTQHSEAVALADYLASTHENRR